MSNVRSSPADSAKRAFGAVFRATIQKVDDAPKRQQLDLNLHDGETKLQVERFSQYGFKSVPLAPDNNQYAGALVAFLNGNRSHAVVFAVDDKRYNPTNWKPGDSGFFHYKGAAARFTDAGYMHDGGTNKTPAYFTIGNATFSVEDGKIIAKVDGMLIQVTASRVDLGGTGGSGVTTEAGISSKVFAIL